MEPEDENEQPTSDYEEEASERSEFTSVTTSRLRYTFEQGRRYQAFLQGRYGLPNDDIEQMREGIKHKLYVDYILDGELHFAPIGDHPQKIVDLGTGVGFWAQDSMCNPALYMLSIDILQWPSTTQVQLSSGPIFHPSSLTGPLPT